jgi:hypothetical protein
VKAAIPVLTVREGDIYMTEAITATPGTRVVNGLQVPEPGTWAIDPSHASFEFVAGT